MSAAYVIAEMGSTHDGDLENARRLVDLAAHSGADAVKAQFWSSATRLAERRHAPDALETYRRCQVPEAWLPVLADAAARCGLDFLCTTYLPEDIPRAAPYVRRFKIASFEAGDREFVAAHVPYGRRIIMSTGLMTDAEVLEAKHAWKNQPVDFLYCVSAYPTPLDDLHLACVADYDGLSDHSGHVQTGGWAAMLGARIIEVHYRLWTTLRTNPDFPHSVNPDRLHDYIRNIREAERALGTAVKRVRPSEAPLRRCRVTEGSP